MRYVCQCELRIASLPNVTGGSVQLMNQSSLTIEHDGFPFDDPHTYIRTSTWIPDCHRSDLSGLPVTPLSSVRNIAREGAPHASCGFAHRCTLPLDSDLGASVLCTHSCSVGRRARCDLFLDV